MSKSIQTLNSAQILSEIGVTDWSDSDFAVIHTKHRSNSSISYPFRVVDYSVGYVTEGYSKTLVNLQKITLRKNSLFVFKPFDVVEVTGESKDLAISGFSFTKDFIVDQVTDTSLLDNLQILKQNNTPIIEVSKSGVAEFNRFFSAIDYLVAHKENPHRKKMIKSIFELLLYGMDAAYHHRKIKNKISTKKDSRKNELTTQFRNLLLQNYREQRSVSFYANNLFVTAKYLSESVKEITGKTAGELIDEMVILEAKILLKNSTNTISEIADILHFSDQFFFSNFFKKHTGLSPSNYRKAL